MCFTLIKTAPKLIAKEDITCYKVIHKNFTSLYYSFQYVVGELVKSDIVIESTPEDYDIIDVGLHSYTDLQIAIKTHNAGVNIYLAAPIIVECIIPEGSEYYENPFDREYVSNQLIVTKKL